MSPHGAQANRSGRGAEDVIAGILRAARCRFDRQATIGHTIYGHELRVDFLVTNIHGFPDGLVIESKWQDQSGTADEKFPYLVENIRALNIPAVVVLHGNGYRPGATRWLRLQVDGKHLIAVYSLEEFMSWMMRSVRVVVTDSLM